MPVKLIKYLPHLVAALLLAAALGLAYRAGFQTAYNEQQVIIEQAKKTSPPRSWHPAGHLPRNWNGPMPGSRSRRKKRNRQALSWWRRMPK